MDAETLKEMMLDDPSLAETVKEFCEGSLTPKTLYDQMAIVLENIRTRLNEPEGLDHEKERSA